MENNYILGAGPAGLIAAYYLKTHWLVDEKTYDEMMKALKNIDLSEVVELEDNTNLSGELACAGGSCEIT